jgi:hypothetical protein
MVLADTADSVPLEAEQQFQRKLTEAFKSEIAPFRGRIKENAERLQIRLEAAYLTAVRELIPAVDAERIDSLKQAEAEYNKAMATALAPLLLKAQATFEYHHLSPANQANMSSFRFVMDKKIWRKKRLTADTAAPADDYEALLTLNLGATIYENLPEGVRSGRWRDAQLAGQFDRKVGPARWQTRPFLSIAGYYQYQKENAILQFQQTAQTPLVPIPLPKPAVEVLDTKGHIGIIQAKLTLPLGGVLALPLAISWSNRTELIKANEVRGQFGITVDIDKLFGTE